MKKSAMFVIVLLAMVLCAPLTSRADARLDLAASGGALLSTESEYSGSGLVHTSLQITWPVTTWLNLGLRQTMGFSSIGDPFGDCTDMEDTGSSSIAWLPSTQFISRFELGSRVRLSNGLGIGLIFSNAQGIMMFLPFPVVSADLDVVLYRHKNKELTLRMGGDVIFLWSADHVVAQPRAGLTYSF